MLKPAGTAGKIRGAEPRSRPAPVDSKAAKAPRKAVVPRRARLRHSLSLPLSQLRSEVPDDNRSKRAVTIDPRRRPDEASLRLCVQTHPHARPCRMTSQSRGATFNRSAAARNAMRPSSPPRTASSSHPGGQARPANSAARTGVAADGADPPRPRRGLGDAGRLPATCGRAPRRRQPEAVDTAWRDAVVPPVCLAGGGRSMTLPSLRR